MTKYEIILSILTAVLLVGCATEGTLNIARNVEGRLGIFFRVMTYNIHHAEGMDGKVDLERIADVIRRELPDMVALQEVDQNTVRTGKTDFPAELARMLNMHVVFGDNIGFQGGKYGNAILSLHPIIDWKNRHLEQLGSGEQRGTLQAVIEIRETKILLVNTHLDHRPSDRERLHSFGQFKGMIKMHKNLPVIFCGDFNDTPDSPLYQGMRGWLADAWKSAGTGNGFTISSTQPKRRIDYIWHSRRNLIAHKIRVPKTTASDHLPVVAEFEIVEESTQ